MNNTNTEKTFTFVGTFNPTEDLPEIKTETRLIVGKLNNCKTIYYWEIDSNEDFEIGDYAIVENKNDYDLVKIIGAIHTNDKYKKFITNSNNIKKVIKVIERNEIRGD